MIEWIVDVWVIFAWLVAVLMTVPRLIMLLYLIVVDNLRQRKTTRNSSD